MDPHQRKGKLTTRRSWSDLPNNVLSNVAMILFASTYQHWLTHPLPSWRDWVPYRQPQLWATLMALHEISSLRLVCLKWQAIMETCQVYHIACTSLDPLGLDAQYYPPVPRLVPSAAPGGALGAAAVVGTRRPRIPAQRTFTNYTRTFNRCCIPCRFTSPHDSKGVNAATATIWTRYTGEVGVCDGHNNDFNVCGYCLKDWNFDGWRWNSHGQPYNDPRNRSIVATEDDEFFRGVQATCRFCRTSILRQILRGKIPQHAQPLTDPICETFIDSGEGTVNEILAEVDEKVWLATYTNFRELHSSALAVERMRLKQEYRADREAEGLAYGSRAQLQTLLDSGAPAEEIQAAIDMQVGEEEEDDEYMDEDLGETLTAAEEANVSDMAMSAWARTRIIDGCWISPLDIWHGDGGMRARNEVLQRVPQAWHPVNSYFDSSESMSADAPRAPVPQNQMKPQMGFIRCPHPPGRIFQRAQTLYEYSFRQIVSPALNNLVQRLICEAESEGKDICRVLTSFTTDMLLEEMRTIQLWGKDYDWANIQTSPTITSTTATFDSVSERSRGSPASTLTTPSPSPPAETSPKSAPGVFAAAQNETRIMAVTTTTTTTTAPPPAVEPVMPLPVRYLDHIPHIPRAAEHLGSNTRVLLDAAWKDVIAPLFKCQCGICLRANGVADARRRVREREVEKGKEKEMRESAPSPSMEEDSDGEDGEVLESSPPVSPTPLRRSREATEDEAEDEGREAKRQRITPPADEVDGEDVRGANALTPMSVDELPST